MPTFLIADDHSIVRTGLNAVISNSIMGAEVKEADDGESVIREMKSTGFDLLILDVNMPDTESFGLCVHIRKEYPSVKIIIYTMHYEKLFAQRFLRAGVHGYLTKDASDSEVRYAIEHVLKGRKYVGESMAELLSEDMANITVDNPFEQLSDRELEIVLELLKGNHSAEIARNLNLHKSTVGTHKLRIMGKLKISNTIELVTLAKLHNII